MTYSTRKARGRRKRECGREECEHRATGYLHFDPDGFLCEDHIEELDDHTRGLVEPA